MPWMNRLIHHVGVATRLRLRRKRSYARMRLLTLEDRCTPNAVSWDGGNSTLNWGDAKNWNPDGVPGAADDVTINVAGNIVVQYTSGSTTIKSLQLQDNLNVTGGSLIVSGTVSVASGYYLQTNGSGASFTGMGATSANGASFYAFGGSTLSLPGLTSYDGLNISIPTLQADGSNSVLDLSKLTTLKGSTANDVRIYATAKGKLDLSGATTISGGGVDMYSNAVGSTLLAGQLTTFSTTNQSYLEASAGGQATLTLLNNADGTRIYARSGSTLSLPALTSYNGLTASQPTLLADGAGSVLDVSAMTSLKGGTSSTSNVSATAGGKLDISKLTTVTGGGIVLQSDGANSMVIATQLTTIANTTPSQVIASNVGQISAPVLASVNGSSLYAKSGSTLSLPGLTSYDGLNISIPILQADGANSVLDLSKLTSLKGSTVNYLRVYATNAGKLDLSGATTFSGTGGISAYCNGANSKFAAGQLTTFSTTNQSYLEASAGGQATLTLLNNADGVRIYALSGSTLSLPALTSYNGLTASQAYMLADGAGSVLDVSAMTSLKGGTGNSTYVSATTGGKLDGSKLLTVTGGGIVLKSDGTGSTLTATQLTTIATTTPSQVTASNGGQMSAPALANANGSSIYALSGSTLSLPGLTSYDGLAISVPSLQADGMNSVLDLSKMTSLKGSTTNYLNLYATNGGKLDLSGLMSITGVGGVFAQADAVGSVLVANQLTTFSTTNQSYLTASNGGQMTLTLLNNADGVRIDALSGSTLSLPALTSYNGLTATQANMLADGVGSVLDVSAMTSLKGGTGNSSSVSSTTGGKLDASKLLTVTGGGIVLKSDGTGSMLTATQLTTIATTTPSQVTASNGGQMSAPALANANGSSIYAKGGSTLSLPGLTSYDGLAISVPSLQADGKNSVLDLSKMTSLKGSTTNYLNLYATNGGKLDLSGLMSITGVGGVFAQADAVGSVLVANQLTTFSTTNQSYLTASNGGQMTLTLLNNADGVRIDALSGSTLSLPALTSYNGLTATQANMLADGVGSVLDVSAMTSLKGGTGNSSSVSSTTGGKLDASKLLTVTGGGIVLKSDGTGSMLTATQLTTIATTTPSQVTASNGGQMSAPALANANGSSIYAKGGSTLSLPGLTSYDGLAISVPTLQADGKNSVLDLSKMTSLKGSTTNYLNLYATNGGKLDLSGLMSVTGVGGVSAQADAVGSVLVANQLTTLSTTSQSYLTASNGGQMTLTLLNNADGMRVYALSGSTLSLPALTSYNGLTATQPLLLADGVGSVLDVSAMTSLKGGTGNSTSVSATTGGKLDVSKLLTVTGGGIVLKSDGTGSVMTATQLTTITTTTPSQVTASNGGQLSAPALANANGSSIYAKGGSTLSLPGLTSYDGLAISVPTLQADGKNSVLDLSKMTSLKGSTTNYVKLYASNGGKLDLSGVPAVTVGGADFEADGAGSTLIASQLASLSSGITSYLYATNGATVQLSAINPTTVVSTAVRVLTGGTTSTNRLDLGVGSTLDADSLGGSLSGVGDIRPASSATGPLTIAGNLTLSAGALLETQIKGTSAGNFDSLVVNGNVSLGESKLVPTFSYSPTVGDTIKIIDNDGTSDPVVGKFAGLWRNNYVATASNGLYWLVNYTAGDGNDVTLKAHPVAMQIEANVGQRSMVRTLNVLFSNPVTLGAGAFTLSPSTNITANVNIDGAGKNATITFTGSAILGNSLPDGRYTLTINGSAITVQGTGLALDADADGTPGGSLPVDFHRLFGDSDGNGVVNTVDFLAFRSAFGGTSTIFSFNNSGTVTAADFLAFRSRFGSSV